MTEETVFSFTQGIVLYKIFRGRRENNDQDVNIRQRGTVYG